MHTEPYAVILAGGRGTRFWPLSRARRPKQLLKLLSSKSLVRETADRAVSLCSRKNILVVTVRDQYRELRKELRDLPRENFLLEPQGNNTAPSVGLAAIELAARDPEALMVVLPADHWISDGKAFRRTIKTALKLAETEDVLVTIGVKPRYPETGYGYILKGKPVKGVHAPRAFRAKAFKEKPSRERAHRLIASGALWNSGIFVWRAATILSSLSRFSPAVFRGLERIRRHSQGRGRLSSARARAALRTEYGKMPNISIDHAVLEKSGASGTVLVMEARFPWNDVGSWQALREILPRDGSGNVGIGSWFGLDSKDCVIHAGDRLVVVLGMYDALIVDSPDVLLVGNVRRAQEIRQLVGQLEKSGYRRLV